MFDQMTLLINSGWMVKFPLVLSMITQSSPGGRTAVFNGVVCDIGGYVTMVATWFAIRLWPLMWKDLVMNLCTGVNFVQTLL